MIPDIIATIVIALVIGGAIFYIVKAKKSGKKCIGCPDSCSCDAKANKQESIGGCSGSCASCQHCHGEQKQE